MFLSSLPALAAVIGGLFAIFKYLHEIKQARKAEENTRREAALAAIIEARKPFLTMQQEVSVDLVKTTAILGNNYANTLDGRSHSDTSGSFIGARFPCLQTKKWEALSMPSLTPSTTPRI
jgi:hypothetical protein